jgi:hypothetical protein
MRRFSTLAAALAALGVTGATAKKDSFTRTEHLEQVRAYGLRELMILCLCCFGIGFLLRLVDIGIWVVSCR